MNGRKRFEVSAHSFFPSSFSAILEIFAIFPALSFLLYLLVLSSSQQSNGEWKDLIKYSTYCFSRLLLLTSSSAVVVIIAKRMLCVRSEIRLLTSA